MASTKAISSYRYMPPLGVCFIPFYFYRRPQLAPGFMNQIKYKKNLHLHKKIQKARIALSICFVVIQFRGSVQPKQQEWSHQDSSPGTIVSILASSHCHSFELYLWTSLLCFKLFCASVSKMCPAVIASSLYIILACKKFHRITLLLDSRETCVMRNDILFLSG